MIGVSLVSVPSSFFFCFTVSHFPTPLPPVSGLVLRKTFDPFRKRSASPARAPIRNSSGPIDSLRIGSRGTFGDLPVRQLSRASVFDYNCVRQTKKLPFRKEKTNQILLRRHQPAALLNTRTKGNKM